MPICSWCDLKKSRKEMSREHIWPNWMNSVFPVPLAPYDVTVRQQLEGEALTVATKRAVKINERVPTVCATCNNGWMSAIENEVKPLMTPLLLAHPGASLDPAQALLVACWAAKTVAVLEDVHGRRVTTQEQRHLIRQHKMPPPQTHVHAAWYSGADGPVRVLRFTGEGPAGGPYEGRAAAVTGMILGALVLIVLQSPSSSYGVGHEVGCVRPDYVSLWPPVPTGVAWPPQVAVGRARVHQMMHDVMPGAQFPAASTIEDWF